MSDQKTTGSPQGPLDTLTPEQRTRLKGLSDSISFDKLTVSFSIEDRDSSGRKKSAFYSVTASRGAGAEMSQMNEASSSSGFVGSDVKVARLLLRKHVVASTYEDAMRSGIISKAAANEELRAIMRGYDEALVKALTVPGEAKGDDK